MVDYIYFARLFSRNNDTHHLTRRKSYDTQISWGTSTPRRFFRPFFSSHQNEVEGMDLWQRKSGVVGVFGFFLVS